MNRSAQQHLTKAKDYASRGEKYYRKCAEEIIAAQEADPTLTQRQIGEAMERNQPWVSVILDWHTGDDVRDTPFAGKSQMRMPQAAKMLREAPPEQIAEIVAGLEPRKRQEITRAIDRKSLDHQKEREQAADEKLREKLGDETVDDLEFAEKLKSTEYLLITARGNLRGFVRHAGEIGESSPEGWRESCLDWIEDLEGHLGMARALLTGNNIDWTAFEDMLEQEGR